MLRRGRFVRCALPAMVAGENSGHHNASYWLEDLVVGFARISTNNGGESITSWARDWRWDPRPDLVSDHELWELLLAQVVDNCEIGWVMNGCRCAGCTLEWNGTMLKLVPLIDPTLGFDSEEDWHDFRSKWLVPNAQAITKALRQLAQVALKREA